MVFGLPYLRGTDLGIIEAAAEAGADRIELYTEPYAEGFNPDKTKAVKPFAIAANRAHILGLGVNAGHDFESSELEILRGRSSIS